MSSFVTTIKSFTEISARLWVTALASSPSYTTPFVDELVDGWGPPYKGGDGLPTPEEEKRYGGGGQGLVALSFDKFGLRTGRNFPLVKRGHSRLVEGGGVVVGLYYQPVLCRCFEDVFHRFSPIVALRLLLHSV